MLLLRWRGLGRGPRGLGGWEEPVLTCVANLAGETAASKPPTPPPQRSVFCQSKQSPGPRGPCVAALSRPCSTGCWACLNLLSKVLKDRVMCHLPCGGPYAGPGTEEMWGVGDRRADRALAFWSCSDKLLSTTDTCSFTVLEVPDPNSRCCQSWYFAGLRGKTCSMAPGFW